MVPEFSVCSDIHPQVISTKIPVFSELMLIRPDSLDFIKSTRKLLREEE